MRLTQSNADKIKLPKGKADHVEWDDALPGFGLRLRDGGSKVWIVQYKIGAKNRRLTLGKASELTADQARNGWEADGSKHSGASLILANAGHGIDAANVTADRRSKAGNTFGAMSADFLTVAKANTKPKSYEDTERYINIHWKPLHSLAVDAVTRAVVAAQLRVIAKERGDVSADRARSALSRCFSWAIGEGLADTNPVIGTNKAAGDYEGRERILTDTELAAVWTHAPANDFGRIVRLLMLTACRRDEIADLGRSEIVENGDGAPLIALPGERTKNGLPHAVPLTDSAMAILNAIPERGDRELVFGNGVGGFSGWSKAKTALDELCGVKDWTLHDLRRTAATRMADCGVQPHIVEAVLNHISGSRKGVAGVYNRAAYAAEKRDALERLATYIQTATARATGGNVTRMKPKDKSA